MDNVVGPGRRGGRLAGIGTISIVACGLVIGLFRVASSHGDADSRVPLAADFLLRDQFGHPFRLSDRRGRVIVLSFGYTNCPEACPLTLSVWKKVREALGDRSKEVDFVYVTVDPQRDTPERLRERLAAFSPDFIGLSGTPAALDDVYRSYRVDHLETRVSATESLYSHNSTSFVIDRQGRVRLELPYLSMTGSGDELQAGITKLLTER